MGNCVSTDGGQGAPPSSSSFSTIRDPDASQRSAAIDKQIHEDAKKMKKECKILLLGSSESGKSTIVKQMRIIHQDGFSLDARMAYRAAIHSNLMESAVAVVLAMKKFEMESEDEVNREGAENILAFDLETATQNPNFFFPLELAVSIIRLWQDPVVKKMMDLHSSHFYLMDSASYFFEEATRIAAPDYVPSETDVLRCRQKSTAITETRFVISPLSIHLFDVGGQRSERKKWIHCFESVTSIIFCVALSEYDQVLMEEKSQNRMAESLVLFESIINSRWFMRTSIILFLNKIDIFRQKVRRVPIERYFPEYTGGPDVSKASKYVLWKFMHANRAKLSVYPHITQATNTSNIRLVFVAITNTILKNSLQDTGIL